MENLFIEYDENGKELDLSGPALREQDALEAETKDEKVEDEKVKKPARSRRSR